MRTPFRVITAALVVTAFVGLTTQPAPGGPDVEGGSGPDGVTIEILRIGGVDRARAPAGSGDGCGYRLAPLPSAEPGWTPPDDVGPSPAPDAYLASLLRCGTFVGLIWVGSHNVLDVDAEARRVVEQYIRTIPVPTATLRASPAAHGITGLESWFWLVGYRADPIVERLAAFGVTVDVEIVATSVDWSFGDGSAIHAGPGQAYPTRSDVTHVFTDRSTDLPTGVVEIGAEFAYRPRYRVDGTDWQELAPIGVRASRPYVVKEIQAVLGP